MPRRNTQPTHGESRKRQRRERTQAERQEIENEGGWFLHYRRERERREAEARQAAHDKIVTYSQRQIINTKTKGK